MNISPEEAQASLAAIQQTRDKTRKARGLNGYYSIIWGLIWFFGFLAAQFMQNSGTLGWIWGILVTVGWVSSALLGMYQSKQVRSTLGPRIGFFYLALISFAVLWFIILQPLSAKQNILFLITIIMFGGIIAAILERVVVIIVGCLIITALALLGYYWQPSIFFLWVALSCGLPMVGAGLATRLHWR